MQQRADECEAAGCIKRETALCIFENWNSASGFRGEAPQAQVVLVQINDDLPFVAWDVWSTLTPEDQRLTGYAEVGCAIDSMTGEPISCGGRSAPYLP